MSTHQTIVNAGGEVAAFSAMLTGFVSLLPSILTVIALLFSIVWYALHIWSWFVEHKVKVDEPPNVS